LGAQRLHAFVSGRVQGVGFRWFVIQEAQERNLTGWCRNLYNGKVEVLAEGELEALNDLLQLLRKGPGGSRVSDVEAEWSPAKGEFRRFSVRDYA